MFARVLGTFLRTFRDINSPFMVLRELFESEGIGRFRFVIVSVWRNISNMKEMFFNKSHSIELENVIIKSFFARNLLKK